MAGAATAGGYGLMMSEEEIYNLISFYEIAAKREFDEAVRKHGSFVPPFGKPDFGHCDFCGMAAHHLLKRILRKYANSSFMAEKYYGATTLATNNILEVSLFKVWN